MVKEEFREVEVCKTDCGFVLLSKQGRHTIAILESEEGEYETESGELEEYLTWYYLIKVPKSIRSEDEDLVTRGYNSEGEILKTKMLIRLQQEGFNVKYFF